MSWPPGRPSWLSWSGPLIPPSRTASMAASIWTLGAILRSTAWSPLRISKVRFGAYAVFTFTAGSGRHRMVLRLLERPIVNRVLGAGFRRFRDLSPAARERYLLTWSTSRFAQRRSAYQALRKLLCFLAYADPGEPGAPNPHWARIGYRPDVAPLPRQPTPIRPLA